MGIKNLRQVEANQKRLVDEWLPEQALAVQKQLAFRILGATVFSGGAFVIIAGLVQMTPVRTGRARSNWQTSFGEPASGEVEASFSGSHGDPATGAETARAVRGLAGAKPFGLIWIVNNLPYIVPLNKGHSHQAPAGWIEVAIENAFASLRRAA